MTRVRLKKAVELPAQVREIVDKVINTPFDALPSVLEGFSWRFEKGDFNHWATLFNYFDELLERALTPRRDLTLNYVGTGDDTPFPSRSLLAILRVSAIILENCSNKHLYHSYEHLTSLLAAPDPAVVIATLHTLVAFVRKTHASSVRWHGWPDLNARLLALSQGWGGKEEGLDLAACTQSDEEPIRPILALGTTLNFQFYMDPSDTSQNEPETSGARVINLQHVDKYEESEHNILRQLVERFAVPEKLRFPLLTRITVARNFSSLEGRRHLARLRLLSLHILFQCNPSAEVVADFYSQEPEFVSDLVGLLVAGGMVPEDLRILALRVLAVQLLDRAHHGGVITAISSGGQSGLLSMLMHRSIASVAGVAAPEEGSGDQPTYSVQFVDALLTLVGALSASTSGCSALAEAGTLSALLPMLKDFDPAHAGLVASAVRILEAYMDFAPNSATQFREMGGLTDMIERLKAEVSLPQLAAGPEDMQTDAPAPETAAGPSQPAGGDGAVQASAPAAAAPKAAALISYQRRVLLKALLRTIALTSYAPGASARPQEEDTAALFACLRRIFERSPEFGGGLFALAASIMSDQLHHDPLTFNALEQAGLPEAFLNALKAGVLPSGEAVVAVPTTLVALSLNEKGLTRVKESKALGCFVPIFTTSTYLRALQFQGDTPSALGSHFDELMRHVNSLRNDTIEMVLTILRTLCKIGGQAQSTPAQQEHTGASANAQPMETDEGKTADAAPADMDTAGAAASPKTPSDRHPDWHPHVAECIMHTARMLETLLANQTFSRQFVDKGGLQLLLKLYTLKHLPATFGSSGASHAVLSVFRACTQLHSMSVTDKVAEALAEHLRTNLLLAMSIGRSTLQDMDPKRREEYTRCVSSLEGITALASAVSRTTTSMLNEVSKTGRFPGLKTLVLDEPIPEHALAVENVTAASAIIARIGDLERIIHLQIALAEIKRDDLLAESSQEESYKRSQQEEAAQQEEAEHEQALGWVQQPTTRIRAHPNPSGRGAVLGPPYQAAIDGLSMHEERDLIAEMAERQSRGLDPVDPGFILNAGRIGPRAASREARDAEDGDIVEPPAASGSPREASGGSSRMRKKSSEDLALEVLIHFTATVRGFYTSLTKSIHTPLRRREEALSMTPAIRSTALHLGLVMKMNCEGVGVTHWDGASSDVAQGAEASSSSGSKLPAAVYKDWSDWKARYLSSIVDDLAAVLFDNRRGTCHCLMLNYWIRCGGLQAFLAQFGTAAQFLWDVTEEEAAEQKVHCLEPLPGRARRTPEEAAQALRAKGRKEGRITRVLERAEALLASMLALMNQLADSARILNSPLAASLLTVPLNDEDQETNAAWSNAENLVKSLKSAILDAVLPVWSNPLLASGSPQNTSAVTSILKHCTEAVTSPASRSGARGMLSPDPAIVQQVVEMGFSEERVREALRRVGHNSVELAMEWLISHPEEAPMEPAPAPAPPQNDQVPAVAKEMNLVPAQALLKPKNEAPSTEQLVDGAVSVLEQVPSAAFLLADLLKSHSTQQSRREDEALLMRLLQRLHSGDSYAETVRSRPPVSLLGPAHLLALLCDEDPGMRRAAGKTGLPTVALGLLEAWVAAHATRPSALKGMGATEVEPVPRWVDALLLVLDACTHIDWQAPSPEAAASAPQAPTGANRAAGPQAEQGMDVDVPAAAEACGTSPATPASAAQAPGQAPESAGTSGAPAPEPKPTVEDVFRKLPRHEGILSEEDEDRAMKVAMALLRHLHAWGAAYQEPAQPLSEKDVLQQPEPSSSAQGVLLLLSCLTKRHSIALKVLAGKGPKLILDMPLACFTSDLEPYISAIMRHILEDPITLQAAMEAEIRSTLSKGRHKPSGYPSGSQQPDGSMPVRQFLQTCAAVINREPTTFFEAVLATCTIHENNGRPLVVLKKAKADGPKASDDKKDGDAPSGGGPPEPSTGGAAGASGASGPSAATPGPQGNPPSSSGGVGSAAAGGSTPGPSGSGPPNRRDSGSHRRHGGGGGGTPGGPPGGGPGGGGGGGGGGGKTPKDKDKGPSKSGKKVPSSFVEVIDTLVDLLLRYEGPYTQPKPKDTTPAAAAAAAAAAMDTDAAAPPAAAAESAGPAVAGAQEAVRASAAERLSNAADDVLRRSRSEPLPPAKQVLKQEEKDMMVQCIALKMLTDFTLMYNACVGVLLKRDAEGTRGRGSSPPSTPAAPKADSPAQSLLFRHVMHRHLVYIPEPDVSVLGLAEQASFYLMAVCIRSAEGRKRIITEIVRTLTATSDQKAPASFGAPSPGVMATIPFKQKTGCPPPYKVKAFVELAGSLLSAGAAKSQAGQPTGLSGEMLRCMRTSGVINALIGALKLVDMDHPNAVKSITSILKPLEILTRLLPPSLLGMPRQAKQLRLFDRARADFGTGAPGPSEPDVERALAALGGPSSVDEPMRDAQDDSAAAGPEAVAAAERLRQAFEREQNGDVEGLARSVESVMEHIIEHAYGDEGMEGYGESDSEEGTDEDVIESEEDDAMGEEPMPEMTDEEDEDLDDPDDGDDEHHHRRHHRHHDSADNSVYSDDDDESSSDESNDEDHEVDVIFDDLEEDAMVGPLLGDDQLIMEHGGDEEGDTEDEDDMHDGGDDGEDHGHYDDGDEDDEGDEDEDQDGDGEEFGMDDLPGIEDHEFVLGEDDDAEALMAWPEEDGLIGEADFHPANPYAPRWVGIPRMNGTHNLARAGAAAQQNAVEMMMNELLNTGALGGLHVDGRDTRFRYRMRTSQPPSGGPSAGSTGGAGVPRHRLLQRPATVPGGRGTAGEARSANEMRVLGMNQPFPAIFGGDDAAGAGEYWMITADPGQRGFATGPRSIVLQAPNAGSLIDFSAGVLQAPGGNASTSNWSDDGQPPSAMESTQLAGQLEQSLVETLRQHAAPEEAEQPPAAPAPAAEPLAAINIAGHAEEVRARAVEELQRVTATLEGRRHELEQSQAALFAGRQRGLNILRQMNERMSVGDHEVLMRVNSTHREALQAAEEQHARLMSSAARDTSEGLSALARAQASLEQVTRDALASGDRDLTEQAAALGGTWETQRRSMRTVEDTHEDQRAPTQNVSLQEARDALDRSRLERVRLADTLNAIGERTQQPATTETPTDAQVEAIRRSVGARVAGLLREGGSEAAATRFEHFMTGFDPRSPAPVPDNLQAMIRDIEDAARVSRTLAAGLPENMQPLIRSIEDAARVTRTVAPVPQGLQAATRSSEDAARATRTVPPVAESMPAMMRSIEDDARHMRNLAAGLPENMQPLIRSIEDATRMMRTMAPVPVNLQSTTSSIGNAARVAQPSAEAGPSRSAAAGPRTASTGAHLTRVPRPLAEPPTPPVSSEAVDRLVQAIRARHGVGQPQQGGDQTPALTAAAIRNFPPPAPRRTRYQARLRRPGGTPGAEEADQRQRQLREAMDAFARAPPSNIRGPSGAIDPALFSSAISAAMTGIAAPRPQPSLLPPASAQLPPASSQPAAPVAPPPIIGADLLSAALSSAQAGPSASAAQEPGSGVQQHMSVGRDVEMEDAEQHAEESSEGPQAGSNAHPAGAAGEAGAFSSPADLARRLEGTGIDPEVFLAMPPELQREVLGEEAANEPAAEQPQPMDTAQAGQEAAPAEGGPRADAAGPSAQNDSDDEMAGIDPEFLAALPEELQAEVLEAQRRERRQRRAEAEHAAAQAAAASGEGGPQELDLATTLASFPPEVRDEVLMTADEEMLAQLPPAILAEAQALRERAHGRPGARHPSLTARRSGVPASAPPEIMTDAALASIRENARRRGELARARLASGVGRLGTYGGLTRDGIQATVENHLNQRALATQNMLAFMHPGSMELHVKVDEDALVTLVSLLRVSSQQAKGHLQKLFINLCEDRATMESTLQILLSLLRAPLSADEAQLSRPRPDQPAAPASLSAALQAGEGSGAAEEAPELLPLVQLGILPRGATAVPPAMTRRVLELLAQLAKQTVRAAPELISLRIRPAEVQAAILLGMQDKKSKGKAPAEGGVDANSKPGLESRVSRRSAYWDKNGKGKAPAEGGIDADSKPGLRSRAFRSSAYFVDSKGIAHAGPDWRGLDSMPSLKSRVFTSPARFVDSKGVVHVCPDWRSSEDKKGKGKAPAEEGADADSKPGLESQVSRSSPYWNKKGKGKVPAEAGVDADSKPGLDVLLELLGKTLCKRSSAHLEAALNCLEVTLSVTKRFTALTESTHRDFMQTFEQQAERGIPAPQQEAAASGAPTAPQDNTPSGEPQTPVPAVRSGGEEQPSARPNTGRGYEPYVPRPYVRDSLARIAAESLKSSKGPLLEGVDPELLRRLPRLLGQAGLSDAAYKRAARCIRLVVLCSEDHKTPMLNELESELHKLSGEVVRELQKMVDGKAGAGAIVNMGVGALGVRILCICEVISALINPKAAKDQTPLLVGSADLYKDMEVDPRDVAGLEELISRMEPLWAALSNAIAVLEADLKVQPSAPADAANPNRVLPPGANQVLPLVKAFFVLCEPRTSHLPPPLGMRRRSSTSVSMDLSLAPVTSEAALAPGASPDSKPQEAQLPFLRFAERHRRLVNVLIQQNVQLLLEGPLTQLMRAPRLIDFDNKRLFFRSQVRSSSDRYHGSLRIHVRREHLFEDSFHQLRSKTPEEMQGKLHVVFHGEEGVDAGGVTREWYQVMAREMFNPNISLFVPTGGSTFQPNPNSIVQNDEARGTNHLDFFKFVGRVVGKALYDGQVIDAYFTRSFYKHMLGQPLTYQDIEGVDPEYYKNLTWLLEHDMTDVVDLNFVEEVDYFGRVEHVELKPGGRDIKVTNENKREYVDLVAEHRMTTAIRAQIQAFLKGFWEMVPRDLISMFNDNELELLISGLPDIDVEDLRANTEYQGYSPASPVIQYFWEVVRELDREDLALLVQFVTGTSKVPLDGFKALQGIGGPQKFSIHKAYGGQQKLPAAHTCFNQLDLVEYESKEQLRDRLMIALHEGNVGFGFV